MAITVDATSYEIQPEDASSASWSHTVGSNDARVLVVTVSGRAVSQSTRSVSAVAFSGTSGTLLKRQVASDKWAEVWMINNPTSTTANITVALTGAERSWGCGAISFYNADGSAVDATAGSSGTTDPSTSITTTLNQCYVVDVFYHFADANRTKGASQTQIYQGERYNDRMGGSYKFRATAGATTMSWSGDNNSWVSAVVSIKSKPLEVSPTETVTVTEDVTLDVPVDSPVSDSITLTDSPKMTLISDLIPTESITVSEYVDVTIRDGLQISIWQENITVTDKPEFPGPRDEILEENVTVTEKVTVKITDESNDAKPNIKVEY